MRQNGERKRRRASVITLALMSHQLGGLISLICHGSSIYGHAFGGSVVRNFYQGKKDADMVYIDFSLIF